MLKFIETTGKTEEEAISAALRKLGMDRDDVSVEILERPKAGFLGIGGIPAKVKVSYEAPDEPAPVETPAPPRAEKTETPAAPKAERTQAPRPRPTVPAGEVGELDEEVRQSAEAFLTGLMHHMFVEAQVKVELGGEGIYEVELVGQDLGALIGRRGETLDAIQQLTNYAVNKGRSKRVRIHVDAENYRGKREEALIQLANKVAAKVVKYRHSVTLEPMNAYERHVIHTALQEVPQVSTYSVGTEPNRRTVVALGKD